MKTKADFAAEIDFPALGRRYIATMWLARTAP